MWCLLSLICTCVCRGVCSLKSLEFILSPSIFAFNPPAFMLIRIIVVAWRSQWRFYVFSSARMADAYWKLGHFLMLSKIEKNWWWKGHLILMKSSTISNKWWSVFWTVFKSGPIEQHLRSLISSAASTTQIGPATTEGGGDVSEPRQSSLLRHWLTVGAPHPHPQGIRRAAEEGSHLIRCYRIL